MNVRWLKPLSLVIAIVFMADVAFAGQTTPAWTTRIDAGSAVQVTLRNGVVFDAIWMGRDGDRALFERFPHETVSVALESVRRVKGPGRRSSDTAPAFGVLGAVVGFFGAGFLLGMILAPRT